MNQLTNKNPNPNKHKNPQPALSNLMLPFDLDQELQSAGYNFLHNCQCLPLPHLLFY